MRVFSHYENVEFMIGVSVVGIPQYIVHRIIWYKNIPTKPFVKSVNISPERVIRNVQKFSSTRPNRKKDSL